MDMGISGRTAIVTGAARNIGKDTALMLAAEGVNLALCTSSSTARLSDVATEASNLGVRAIAVSCDIADRDSVDKFIGQAVAEFGGIDILINNAVYREEADFFDITEDGWDRNIAVNLSGPFHLCRSVLPHMQRSSWGRIVNYSGIGPYLGHGPAKAMVKLGIVGFTRGLAQEFAAQNITANCIAPGFIDVERETWQRHKPVPDAQPIRRLGTPSEIAGLAVYLSSAHAGFITGQCYMANGGNYFS